MYLDKYGSVEVGELHGCKGKLEVKNPNLWWPYLMSETPGSQRLKEVSRIHI